MRNHVKQGFFSKDTLLCSGYWLWAWWISWRLQTCIAERSKARILKREDKRQMTSQYGHGFLSIFFGDKYDLIQLHRQIIHQNDRSFFSITKITSPLAQENNDNEMISTVWAGTVFGPRLWSLSACHHPLAGRKYHIVKTQTESHDRRPIV